MSEAVSSADRPGRRALLLDFDGTLADTLPGLRSTYENFLRGINALGTAPRFADVNGANLLKLVGELCHKHAPDRDAAAEWSVYWADVEHAVLTSAPAHGAHEIIAWARQRDWLVGIGSASRSGLISDWLELNSMTSEIDRVVGADLCHRSKPDPEIYRRLMSELGVEADRCIVIEDSLSGIASAHNAGLDVVFLSDEMSIVPAAAAACHRASDLVAALAYLEARFEPGRTP